MAPSAVIDQPRLQLSSVDRILIKPWSRPAPTTEELDWAPLVEIDLSRFDQPGGKQELAKQLYDAVTKVGFWVVTNTGISDEKVLRQFSIGNAFFKEPLEEKRTFPCNLRKERNTGIKENIEMLNIPKPIIVHESVPRHRIVQQNWGEIASFHRELWHKVARKLFSLISIILELPEDYLVNAHDYEEDSDDHLRYMIYNIRSQDEWDRALSYSNGGHTDFGSLTFLFSQNVAGLQIQTLEGEWKWVKPVDGGITCNIADTLTFLTKGFLRSTVHRVVAPPADQLNVPRLGLLYFSRPGKNTLIKTVPSPLLERLGLLTEEDKDPSEPIVTGTEYVRARVKDVHYKTVLDNREGTSFEFKGLKVQNYYK